MDYEACGQKVYAFSIRFIHLTNAFKWIPSDKNHHDSLGSCHKVFFFLSFLCHKTFLVVFLYFAAYSIYTNSPRNLPAHYLLECSGYHFHNLTNLSSFLTLYHTQKQFLHSFFLSFFFLNKTTRSSFLMLFTSH